MGIGPPAEELEPLGGAGIGHRLLGDPAGAVVDGVEEGSHDAEGRIGAW